MKTILNLLVLTFLFATVRCFALMSIADVSKERAKEMGLEIRANAAGPEAVRVELEFKTEGALKGFSRVDLDFSEGGKFLVSSSLKEDRTKPERVVVSFAADRAHLDKITMRVVVVGGARQMVGYDIRVKDFVDLAKLR